MYFFVYGDNTSDNRPIPGVQIYWEANGEPEYEFISLYLTDRPADQTENDKVWKYFQNLFEMGFKLLDTSLYQDTKKEFYDTKILF